MMVELDEIEYEGRHLLAVTEVVSSIDYVPPIQGPIPDAYPLEDFWYITMYGKTWQVPKDSLVRKILSLAQKSIDVELLPDPGDPPEKPSKPPKSTKEKDREQKWNKYKANNKKYREDKDAYDNALNAHNKSKKEKENHLDRAKEMKAAYDLMIEAGG